MTDLFSLWLLSIFLSVPFIYWYLTRNFNYWRDRGIKGPKPTVGLGNFIDQQLTKKPRSVLEIERFNKYGKIYGIFEMNSPILVVGVPELIKNILLKDFNVFTERFTFQTLHPILKTNLLVNDSAEDWKRIRSLVGSAFTSGKMRKMYPMMKVCVGELLDTMQDHVNSRGINANVGLMYENMTMDVIATCAFGIKTNAHKDQDNDFIKNGHAIFDHNNLRLLLIFALPEWMRRLFGLTNPVRESAHEFFFDLIRRLVKERKNTDNNYNDFIQLLINAQNNCDKVVANDVIDSNEVHHLNEGEEEVAINRKVLNSVRKKYITEDELLAQAWVTIVAGYETSATTLGFASYELALNQNIQQRLYEEVMTAVDANGDIDYDILSKLEYLDSVISETLRRYPPVLFTLRKASEDYKLGDTGITIYRGQTVQIPIHAVHHCEEFYEDPFTFNPDRWLPENRHRLVSYTYLPFGAGPRNCIGFRFGLMEIKVTLAQVVRRFRLTRVDDTDVPLIIQMKPFVYSAKRIILGIENR